MSVLPQWARKPDHNKTVIATSRGWMVKETGEYLKLVKNLDVKLDRLASEINESLGLSPDLSEPELGSMSGENSGDTQEDSVLHSVSHDMVAEDSSASDESEETVAEEEQKPKKRGRPKKK